MKPAGAVATGGEVWRLLASLQTPRALTEAAVLLACVLLAWLIAWRARRGAARRDGIWFGDRLFDGVLFPGLALLGALVARAVVRSLWTPSVLQLAVPILSSLLLIRIAVRVLRAAFPSSHTVRLLERTLSWLIWIGLILWLTGLLPLALGELESVQWKLAGTEVSLRALLEGGLTAVAVLVGALWISAAIEARLLAGAGDDGNALSMRKIAANATRAALLLAGVLIALGAAGIPLGALGVFGGALGVGIGFGLQKMAANYVSGFVILAERSLRIGDVVKVDGFEGRVSDIHTRYTVIRALNGRESIVPNELLITSRVENASLADRRVQLTTTVGVAYGTDIPALTPYLVAAVGAVTRVLDNPAPAVLLSAFGNDGLELTVVFWIGDPENGHGNVRSDVNLAILRTLNEREVEIPFPQRVVRVSPGAPPLAT